MARKPGQKPSDRPASAKQKEQDSQKGHDTHHAHDHGPTDTHAQAHHQHEAAAAKTEHAHDHGHDHGHDHHHGHDHGDEKKERAEQKVTIEEAGPARKALLIEVPADRIAGKFKENYSKLREDAVIPGFRRGRAPLRLLEKRFASTMRDDIKTQLMSECYQQAIEEHKLDVVGDPEIKDFDKIVIPNDGPLTFRVEVEVSPTFELPSLEGIEVKKAAVAVADDDVEGELTRIRERLGRMIPVAEGVIEDSDYAMADIKVTGEPDKEKPDAGPVEIFHHPGTYVQAAGKEHDYKGHVVGLMVEDLGKKLIGQKVGSVVNIKMTGPSGHEDERVKDKPVTITLRIDRVDRLEPASLDLLQQQLGAPDKKSLNEKIRELLVSRRQRDQQTSMRQQVINHLLEKTQFDLPAGVSRRQAARLLQRAAVELAYRGMPEPEIERRIAELRQGSEAQAQVQLKTFFVLDQAARLLDVDVSEGEVNGAIASLAVQQNRRPEKLRQQMARQGQIEQLYLQVRDQKTLDKILEKAKVVEGEAPPEAPEAEHEPASKAKTASKGKGKSSKSKKADKEGDTEST